MFCMKCKKAFPDECICKDKEERLAGLSGTIVFPGPDGKFYTPAPVQLKKENKRES